MTQLKIDNNPFAKGFRENGQLRIKKRQLEGASTAQAGGVSVSTAASASAVKKARPDSAASRSTSSPASSLNLSDDDLKTSDLLLEEATPVPVQIRNATNFSIARLVGASASPASPASPSDVTTASSSSSLSSSSSVTSPSLPPLPWGLHPAAAVHPAMHPYLLLPRWPLHLPLLSFPAAAAPLFHPAHHPHHFAHPHHHHHHLHNHHHHSLPPSHP